MNRPNLDSMLLATTDPDRLHDWYAAVLTPRSDDDVDGYRVLRFDTTLFPHVGLGPAL